MYCSASESASRLPRAPYETCAVMFKKYVRPTSSYRDANPRPDLDLVRTTDALIRATLHPGDLTADALDFFSDRSRAIRQDFASRANEKDQVFARMRIRSLGMQARFLIFAGFVLQNDSKVEFKLWYDSLINCMAGLNGVEEFEGYQELLSLKFKRNRVPGKAAMGLSLGIWSQAFARFEELTVLEKCAAAKRSVVEGQIKELIVLNKSLNGKYPLHVVAKWLHTSDELAKQLVCLVGLPWIAESNSVSFAKSQPLAKENIKPLLNRPVWEPFPVPFVIDETRDLKRMTVAILTGQDVKSERHVLSMQDDSW